jgi:hypothetical protein
MAKESVAFTQMAAHKPGQPRKALVADSEIAGKLHWFGVGDETLHADHE